MLIAEARVGISFHNGFGSILPVDNAVADERFSSARGKWEVGNPEKAASAIGPLPESLGWNERS
jgi:hypothetical protein